MKRIIGEGRSGVEGIGMVGMFAWVLRSGCRSRNGVERSARPFITRRR